MWTDFKKFYDLVKKYEKKEEHKVKENVKHAFERLTILNASKFFITYVKFGDLLRDFNENYASYLDADNEQIRKAAEAYFAAFFNDNPENPSINVDFRPKPNSGAQVIFNGINK